MLSSLNTCFKLTNVSYDYNQIVPNNKKVSAEKVSRRQVIIIIHQVRYKTLTPTGVCENINS